MDSIKAQKKLQAMKTHKKAQFVYNFIVYALTAFLSSLFYLYLFCFPSMRHFLFDFLPNFYSFISSPKFLFLLGNIIVIILTVGESNKVGASGLRSSPATEIYDEYMEIRSRSLIRRQAVDECNKKNQRADEDDDGSIIIVEMDNNKNEKSSRMIRRNCSLNNIIKCLEERKKKKEMAMTAGRSRRRPRSVVVEHKKKKQEEDDERLMMMHENEKENATVAAPAPRDDDLDNIRSLDQEKMRNPTSTSASHSLMTRPHSLGRLDMYEISNDDGDGAGVSGVVSKMTSREHQRKEMDKSMDELNRKVEEFIARVNRRRMLEAKELELELNSSLD